MGFVAHSQTVLLLVSKISLGAVLQFVMTILLCWSNAIVRHCLKGLTVSVQLSQFSTVFPSFGVIRNLQALLRPTGASWPSIILLEPFSLIKS